jgi:hypothetical protein
VPVTHHKCVMCHIEQFGVDMLQFDRDREL